MSVLIRFTLDQDPEMVRIIKDEERRQNECLDLIASQSLAPEAIMDVSGSILTNRTIEGYPGKRYYAGGRYLDDMELLAINRAKELFGAEHVNVQPHCGTNTNMAVYHAVLKPEDKVLAMNLAAGGHLSHGHPLNSGTRVYEFLHYGVDEITSLIDYEELRKLALEHRPRIIVGGTSSYPREIDWKKLREIADEISAYVVADVAHTAGLIAAGLHVNPVPYADFVTFSLYKTLPGPRGGCILCRKEFAADIDRAVFPGYQGSMLTQLVAAKAVCFRIAASEEFKEVARQIIVNSQTLASEIQERGMTLVTGGTDSHIILLDVRNRGLTGKIAEKALEKAGLTVNRNVIPFDPEKPWIASGVRIGTTVATMRGMKEKEMAEIASIIDRALSDPENETILSGLKEEVKDLCQRYPIPAREL
jgi:glycine hydroxymethyltransferase